MELVFYELPDKELLQCDLDAQEDDGTLTYDWPFLPRKGEAITLRYKVEETTEEIAGIVQAVYWTSVGGFLNAVAIYIQRHKLHERS
jgi:hypothetical protein